MIGSYYSAKKKLKTKHSQHSTELLLNKIRIMCWRSLFGRFIIRFFLVGLRIVKMSHFDIYGADTTVWRVSDKLSSNVFQFDTENHHLCSKGSFSKSHFSIIFFSCLKKNVNSWHLVHQLNSGNCRTLFFFFDQTISVQIKSNGFWGMFYAIETDFYNHLNRLVKKKDSE